MKAKHKHQYKKYLVQTKWDDFYNLVNVCQICGYRKDPPFKEHIYNKRWLTHLADYQKVYGDLPILKE